MQKKLKMKFLGIRKMIKIISRAWVLGAICTVLPGQIMAAPNWKFDAGAVVSESYNDNLALTATNPKIDDFITEINPYIGVTRKTRGLDLNAAYRLQNLIYASEDQFNDTFHQLNGDAKAEFVKDLFFVKGAASYGQQNINNTDKVSFTNVGAASNRTNVGTFSLNPYVQYRMGNTADMLLSYQRDIVRYGANSIRDNDRNDYQFKLTSGKSFGRTQWQLNLRNQDIEIVNQPDTTLKDYNAQIKYKVTRIMALVGTAGYDDNEYSRLASTERPEGSKWTVGLEWKPSTRTSVEAGVGRRYYGNSGYLRASTKRRRTTISVDYSEDVSVASFDQIPGSLPDTDILPPDPNPINISNPSLGGEVYINKKFSGNLSFRSAKSLLTLSVYDTRRLYQSTDDRERSYGASASLDWDFALRTKATFFANGQITNARASSRQDGLATLRVGIERKLRRKLTGSINLVHYRQDSSVNAIDYEQNTATIGINWQL